MSMYGDSNSCPIDRPGELCVNCGYDWYQHSNWLCYLKPGVDPYRGIGAKNKLPPEFCYLTLSMIEKPMTTLKDAKLGQHVLMYVDDKNCLSRTPTDNEIEVVIIGTKGKSRDFSERCQIGFVAGLFGNVQSYFDPTSSRAGYNAFKNYTSDAGEYPFTSPQMDY